MLLVIIVALSFALVIERRNRERAEEENRALSEHILSLMKSQNVLQATLEAVENNLQAKARSESRSGSQPPSIESPSQQTVGPGR
jgi:hypothetical protein